jgi:hypothetical protein
LGFEQSKALWEHLKATGYINAQGKVQDSLRQAIKAGNLALPAEFAAQRGQVADILRKLSGRLEIKDADKREQVRTRQAVLHSPEFKALWGRIKHQTTYRVQFDNDKLIEDCARALRDAPPIARTRLPWRKADIAIGKVGFAATERAGAATITLNEDDIELPDILSDLQDRTQLARKSVVRILTESGRLDDFKRNPQQFIELAGEIINRSKRMALVDGIKYHRLGDGHFYAQELFEREELTGYLQNMVMDIHAAWDAFWPSMVSDTPPPLTDKDKVMREDAAWQAAAKGYLALKAEADAVADKLDAAKAALVELAKHPSETGSGVTVTRFWKQGSVDYKKVPELAGVELERYRGKAREEVRVTAAK